MGARCPTGADVVNSGDLLIAPACMPDPRFYKSVMLLSHDNSQGSFALCLNRPLDRHIHEILDSQLGLNLNLNMNLYWGGPVNPQTIWMLHDSSWINQHTVPINDRWSMTSHISMFHNLADGNCPTYFRIFSGYAAWTTGQLELELEGRGVWRPESSWLIARDASPEWVLEQAETDLWTQAVELSAKQAVGQWM